jgi:hypothetical protein
MEKWSTCGIITSHLLRIKSLIFRHDNAVLILVIGCLFSIYLLGVFWVVECFNKKWLHNHQLEFYSKEEDIKDVRFPWLVRPSMIGSSVCTVSVVFPSIARMGQAH